MTHEECRNRRKEIADFVRNGKTRKDAVKHFKVSSSYVSMCCMTHGVETPEPMSQTFGKPGALAIIAELLNTKDNLHQISKHLGISVQRVSIIYNLAIKAGIPIETRNKKENTLTSKDN